MVSRWSITHSPTSRDPDRHLLRLKALPSDLRALVRILGALCGRPEKYKKSREYNFSLYLHKAAAETLARVESELKTMTAPQAPSPPPIPPKVRLLDAADTRGSAEGGLAEGEAPGEIQPQAVPLAAQTRAPEASLEPMELPEIAVRRPEAPAGEDLFKTLAQVPWCGAMLELDPGKTFENLEVGPFNRFAHASSMAIVADPGHMYNPLLIFGPPGCGKSHLLHAVGMKFQEQYPNEPIWISSGPRLSVASTVATASGELNPWREFADKAKALLIDDAHLLRVSEDNQKILAEIVHRALKRSAQVMLTSLYPPRLLEELDEALSLRLSSAWSVDLRLPEAQAHGEIILRELSAEGLEAEESDRTAFADSISLNFHELKAWIRRLKVLKALRLEIGQPAGFRDLMSVLFPAAAQPGPAAVPLAAKDISCALFYPQGEEVAAQETWRRLGEEAYRNGWAVSLSPSLRKAYDSQNVHGLPFALAEQATRNGVPALVLGPAPGSDLAAREAEFRHALEHVLQAFSLGVGWIPFAQAQNPAHYLYACLDLVFTLKPPKSSVKP